MPRHVIKHTHEDGEKLESPELWCEIKLKNNMEWVFTDTHHAALSVGGSVQPCKNCIKAIIKELSKEL